MTRIYLIGYMGAGKTTLGKAFARAMGLTFVDLDWYIEERFHKTIRQIFVERGEDGFRELEKRMVISVGGGTPCFFDNMDYMNETGKTVFLDVDIQVLFRRLRVARQQRPLLAEKTDEELMTFICEAIEKRLSFYSQAKYVFNGERLETRHQINQSVERLKELLNL